jgi:RNA polymerase sigma-70 factor (ECF subfamily)
MAASKAKSKTLDLPSATDDVLVSAARTGDMTAFEELVARHRDKVYARAFSMLRKEDEALDLSQEAWVKAWQRLAQFQGDASFLTWITRITINQCLDHLRRRQRLHAESIEQLDEELGGVERQMPVITTNPTEGLERAELRTRIDEGMAQLTHSHRTVLILHEFEGLEYKEVAKRMGCSIGTVMSRLFYARRRLASLLHDLKAERSHETRG